MAKVSYASKNNRNMAEKAMESKYMTANWFKTGICVYCGDIADTKDHIPSISWAYALGYDNMVKEGAEFIKVSCCKTCNSVIGDRNLPTLSARKAFISEYWKKKGEKYKIPTWTIDELNELGKTLKSSVKDRSDSYEFIKRRIVWSSSEKSVAYDDEFVRKMYGNDN